MTNILFICHGNICRSPMAEFIFRDMAEKRGLGGRFYVASAATSTEEIGNPVYPPAKRKLYSLGIDCSGKRARQMTKADYREYDLLLEHSPNPREIDDPWYTGDFDTACRDIQEGCGQWLDLLSRGTK